MSGPLLSVTAGLLALLGALLAAAPASAQEDPAPGTDEMPAPAGGAEQPPTEQSSLLLILDASGSMKADDGSGERKIDVARDALETLVSELPADAPVGLRVYGARERRAPSRAVACRSTKLVEPVAPLDPAAMRESVNSFEPGGRTPIGLSLRKAATDLPGEGQRTIVLVSDGIDNCSPPDPCQVAEQISEQGIELTIQAVGFQVDRRARGELRCIARAGGGTYSDARDAEALGDELRALTVRALRAYATLGEPIEGGPTPAEAAPLEPGQYVDHLEPGEELYYSIEVEPGQVPAAAATLVPPKQVFPSSLGGVFRLELLDANGDRLPGSNTSDFKSSIGFGARSARPSLGVSASADTAPQEPAPYVLQTSLEDDANELPAEGFDLELIALAAGEPLPEPEEEAADEGASDADDGRSDDLLVGGALALVGAGAGLLLTRRRR